jgi:hypothetical protein
MSLHQIAMSTAPTGDLNLIFLDANGQPQSFRQTADGVWHPLKSGGGVPLAIPNPTGISFTAIKGMIDGYGLVALDQTGSLWFTSQRGNIWNADGFSRLAALPGQQVIDFDICEVRGSPLFVAFVANPGTLATSVFAQWGPLNALTQPVALPGAVGVHAVGFKWNSVAIAGLDPRDQGGGDTPIALAVGTPNQSGGSIDNFIEFSASSDFVNWQAGQGPQAAINETFVRVAALIPGYQGFLQAIVLDQNGVPYLYKDTSGSGSNFALSGKLLNPYGLQYSTMAACVGTDGNFQVVGLCKGLPYLVTQSAANGAWSAFKNPNGQGSQLPMTTRSAVPLKDLVMGYGNQRLLQVGYLGEDGIYVNFQQANGNWGWFGPLPGA